MGKPQIIPVTSDIAHTGNIYVGGSIRGRSGKEYYLLPGEYQITDGHCRLQVQNVGPEAVHFRKGDLI